MSFLNVDHKQANAGGDFKPLPLGEYEAFFTEVEATETKETKKPMLKYVLTIRDDVQQEGQKRKVFGNMVMDPSNEYAIKNFQSLAKVLGFEQGKKFDTLKEFAAEVLYKAVRFKNKHEDYQDKTNDRVHFFLESKHGGQAKAQVQNDPFKTDGQQIQISDDDLPF